MKNSGLSNLPKRDHTVIIPNFFGDGQNLEAYQLGWDFDSKIEAKSSVSRKIFEYFVEKMGRNLIFFYVKDGNFYGIHSERCPTPVFIFKKDINEEYIIDQLDGDTHDYDEGEILYMVPCEQKIWDVVKIDGKPLEEVLQDSYIVNIS